MRSDLTIGKLAELAEVNVETIRYYQRRRLLDEPKKPLGGYRRYPSEMAKRVRFIKRAQALDGAANVKRQPSSKEFIMSRTWPRNAQTVQVVKVPAR